MNETTLKTTLKIILRDGAYWITGLLDGTPDCGPYEKKADAESDRAGLERFYNVEMHRKVKA